MVGTTSGDTVQAELDHIAAGKPSRQTYYSTRSAAATAASLGTIPSWATSLEIGGYSAEGDCPRHEYAWRSSVNSGWDSRCYFADASARGGYWVMAEFEVDPRYFGAKCDRFSYVNVTLSTATPNQFTTTRGRFTAADIGKTVGFETGGAPVAARYRLDFLSGIYAGRTLTINGTAITFVSGTATGMQVSRDGTSYDVALALAALVNANSATFGCTASVPVQTTLTYGTSMLFTANTAGTAGNSIAVSTTCETWQLFRYNGTFYGGKASGPLVSTITSVSGDVGGAQTIGIAGTVLANASNVYTTGGTDDYLALKAALSMVGFDIGASMVFGGTAPSGHYGTRVLVIRPWVDAPVMRETVYNGTSGTAFLTSQPLPLYNGATVDIANGAAIAALPGFPAARGIMETATQWGGFGSPVDAAVATLNVKVYGPGSIEANGWADRCLWFRSAQYCVVDKDLRAIGANHVGIGFGDPSARAKSWSNTTGKVFIQNKGDPANVAGTNMPDSIGYHCGVTDHNHTDKIEVVGYRYGIMADSHCHIPHAHVWTWQGGGPLKASFVWRGGNPSKPTSYTAGYLESDTPSSQSDASVGECYAFWTINSEVFVEHGWNFNNTSGGAVANEVVFCRNDGTNYGGPQPTVTFQKSFNFGAILKRYATSSTLTQLEGAVRFIGNIRDENGYASQSGYESRTNEPMAAVQYCANSNFSVWRTPGSQALMSVGAKYGPEGWFSLTDATTGARTMQRVASSVGGSAQYAINEYALQIAQTSVPTNGTYHRLCYRYPRSVLIATGNKIVAHLVTAKMLAGTISSGLPVSVVQNFGTGGSSSVTTTIGSIFPSSGSSVMGEPFGMPSVSGKTIADDAYLEIQISLPLSASGTWTLEFNSVELVHGYVAAWERNPVYNTPIADREMAKRYEAGSVYAPSATAFWVPFKTTKRIAPTVAVSSGAASQITVDGFLLTPTGAGAVTYTADASI